MATLLVQVATYAHSTQPLERLYEISECLPSDIGVVSPNSVLKATVEVESP